MAEKRQRNLAEKTRIAVFRGREVRKTIHNDEWWFVVEDIVAVLTDSADIKQYVNRMRQRDPELSKGWVQFVHTLQRVYLYSPARAEVERQLGYNLYPTACVGDAVLLLTSRILSSLLSTVLICLERQGGCWGSG